MALITAHLNAGHSGGNSVAIGIYSPSSHTSIPPFSPSLISLLVSVDVKHHVYFTLLCLQNIVQELCESRGGRPGLSVLTSLLVSVDVKIH